MGEKNVKIIHYCWFGPKPLSKLAKKCMKSWKEFLPDYEIKLWNEKNFDFNRNVYEAIDSFAWDYYQYYNKPYEEIDLPHILKDMLDNIVDIAEFPKGEYHVLCPDFSYYMFSVSTLQLAEDLNNIIDHVSVYCGHEFIWEQ